MHGPMEITGTGASTARVPAASLGASVPTTKTPPSAKAAKVGEDPRTKAYVDG